MRITRQDVLKPANAVTGAGVAISLWGAKHIDSYAGIAAFIFGRGLDLVDGPVARRTGSSHFGAAMDAGGDKLVTAAAIYYLATKTKASRKQLGGVVLYNLANAGLTTVAEKKGIEMTPSKAGKHAMFVSGGGIVGMALEQVAEKRGHEGVARLGRYLGKLTAASTVVGMGSALGLAEAAELIDMPYLPDYFKPVKQTLAELAVEATVLPFTGQSEPLEAAA